MTTNSPVGTEVTPEARVLVVDDETNIVELLSVSLKFQGFEVFTAANGPAALDRAREVKPDAVILDVMMPGMDGFGVLRRLRADGIDAPALFLTARDTVADKVAGLTLGGDDYVTKPFSLEEVVARLRVILRRSGKGAEAARTSRLSFADIELDEDTHEVWKAGEPVSLSPTEFTLLRYFVINAGTVLSKPKILDHVWRYDFGGDVNVVESYVSYLRRKIDTGEKRLLHTLRAPPEELAELDGKPEPVRDFGPATWFAVSGGRDAGAEPRRLLPILCKAGGLSKEDIGAIRVQKDQSFIQIRNEAVAGFLAAVGERMVLEKGAQLTQLASPPEVAPRGAGLGRGAAGSKAPGAKPPRPKAPESGGQEPALAKKPVGKREYRANDGDKDTVARAPAESDPAARPNRKPKGPPPPKGKPNSKKNRARAAAAGSGKVPGKTANKAGAAKRKPKGSRPTRDGS